LSFYNYVVKTQQHLSYTVFFDVSDRLFYALAKKQVGNRNQRKAFGRI
jgi:hypothetical protein